MEVKCKCHGTKIDRKTAYCVDAGDKKSYYCSEEEYNKLVSAKESAKQEKDGAYDAIYKLFGHKITHTILYKEVGELAQQYTYDAIRRYIEKNSDDIESYIRKDFVSEYAKIRYFTAILKNQLYDFTHQKAEKPILMQTPFEMVEQPKYKPRQRKRGLDEILGGDEQ